MPPLFVLEFLHRIYDIFGDYFGEVSVRSLTDNFSTAYQLLEEMLVSSIGSSSSGRDPRSGRAVAATRLCVRTIYPPLITC